MEVSPFYEQILRDNVNNDYLNLEVYSKWSYAFLDLRSSE